MQNITQNTPLSSLLKKNQASDSFPFRENTTKNYSKLKQKFIFSKRRKSFLGFAVLLLILIALTATVFLSKLNQDIRQQAMGDLYYNSYCSTFRERKCFGPDLYECETPGTAYLTLVAEDAQRCVGREDGEEDDETGPALTFTCCVNNEESVKTIFACERDGGTVGECPRDDDGNAVAGCTSAVGLLRPGEVAPVDSCNANGTRTWLVCSSDSVLTSELRRVGCPQPTEESDDQSDEQEDTSDTCDQVATNCSSDSLYVWVIDRNIPSYGSSGVSYEDQCNKRTVNSGSNYPNSEYYRSLEECESNITDGVEALISIINDKETGENIGANLLDNGITYTCDSNAIGRCRRGYQCTTDGWELAGPTSSCAQDRLYYVETQQQLDELLADTAFSSGPGSQNLTRCPLSPNGPVSCRCAAGKFSQFVDGGEQCPVSYFVVDVFLPNQDSVALDTNVENIVSSGEQVADGLQNAGRVTLLRSAQVADAVLTAPYDGLVYAQNAAANNNGWVEAASYSYLHGQRMRNLYLSGTPYATDEWLYDAYDDPGYFLGGYVSQCGQVGLNVNCAVGISAAGVVSGAAATGGVYAFSAAGGAGGIISSANSLATTTTVRAAAFGSTVATPVVNRVRSATDYVDDLVFQVTGIGNASAITYNSAQTYTALQQGIPPHLALYSIVNLEDDLLAGIRIRNTIVQNNIATTGVGNQRLAQQTSTALETGSNFVDETAIALAFRLNDTVDISSNTFQSVQNININLQNSEEDQSEFSEANQLLQQTRNFCYPVPGGVRVYTSTPTGSFPQYRVNSYIAGRQVIEQEDFCENI